MNYKSIIKKQSFIITASVIVMAIILLGTSYALFTNTDNSSEQVVNSGTLQINYTGSVITTVGGTNGNELVEIEPLSESAVTGESPYKIVVNNTGTLAMKYNIVIYTDGNNTLPHSYLSLKVKENGTFGETKALTSLSKVDDTKTNLNEIKYKLSTTPFTVEPNSSATHELYLWVDESKADDDISNKVVNVKIEVEGDAATPAG